METEVIINKSELESAESNMRALQSSVQNRIFSIAISTSKGDMADCLMDLAERISEIKETLATLYGNTANALTATRLSFEEKDNSIANYFSTFGGISNEK